MYIFYWNNIKILWNNVNYDNDNKEIHFVSLHLLIMLLFVKKSVFTQSYYSKSSEHEMSWIRVHNNYVSLKATIHYATFRATVEIPSWMDCRFWLVRANGCCKQLHGKLHSILYLKVLSQFIVVFIIFSTADNCLLCSMRMKSSGGRT